MTSSVYYRSEKTSEEGSFRIYTRRKRKGSNFNKFRIESVVSTEDEVNDKIVTLTTTADTEEKPIEINVQWCAQGNRMSDIFSA
jgi:hypothetical protein